MSSPQKAKPIWKFWYKECFVQQAYVVLSIISGILLSLYTIMLANLDLHQTGFSDNDILIRLFNKYKIEIILYLILSFIVSFVVGNLILVQYCNMGVKGWKNILFSLVLFFVVLPAVSWLVAYGLGMLLLQKLIQDLKTQ